MIDLPFDVACVELKAATYRYIEDELPHVLNRERYIYHSGWVRAKLYCMMYLSVITQAEQLEWLGKVEALDAKIGYDPFDEEPAS